MNLTPNERLTILVLGYIVRRPLGGGTWPTLQYALGLQRLGHDVWFFEDSEDYPACYDPTRHVTDRDPSFGLAYATDVLGRVGLGERWAYFDAHTNRWHGPAGGAALSICARADLLLAPSSRLRDWTAAVPNRAFIDTDPLFEQIRLLHDANRRTELDAFTSFFTYGHNLTGDQELAGAQVAAIPLERVWQATRPPVVLDCWPVTPGRPDAALTTVSQWKAYAPATHAGVRYGMKADSFAPFQDLPRRCPVPLEMALGGPDAPRSALRAAGWRLRDPLAITKTPWTFQQYIADSMGEFTVAKHGYTESRCGWFSERSAHYLASGRPVITEDTGFETWLPVGDGLLTFRDADGAIAGIEDLTERYPEHCAAARDLAASYFDARVVLGRLVQRAMR